MVLVSAHVTEMLEVLLIPPPNHNMPLSSVHMAISGVNSLHDYINTQLPYPHVHMITVLVHANSTMIAIVAALEFEYALVYGAHIACVFTVLQMLTVPAIYYGLLEVCVLLNDPIGEDILDLPILQYQLALSESCHAMLMSSRGVYVARKTDHAGASEAATPVTVATTVKSTWKIARQPPTAELRAIEELRHSFDTRMSELIDLIVLLSPMIVIASDIGSSLHLLHSAETRNWNISRSSLKGPVSEVRTENKAQIETRCCIFQLFIGRWYRNVPDVLPQCT